METLEIIDWLAKLDNAANRQPGKQLLALDYAIVVFDRINLLEERLADQNLVRTVTPYNVVLLKQFLRFLLHGEEFDATGRPET